MPHVVTIDPSREWQRGLVGWLLRKRGIVVTVTVDCGLALASFLWSHWTVTVLVVGAGVFLVLALLAIRRVRLQRMESDLRLHAFCHETRDDVARILAAKSATEHRHHLDKFHERTVQRIAGFFRELLRDKTVNCAIRLAEDLDGQQMYVTRARSDGMDPCRAARSQPIPSNRGLPWAMLQHEMQGVHIVSDINKAIDESLWMETPNDGLPDVQKVMVSPINGWEGNEKGMLGLLYVTSKITEFQPWHTLPMKAFADLLGLIYPVVVDPNVPTRRRRPT